MARDTPSRGGPGLTTSPDFERIFRSVPNRTLVVTPDLAVVAVSDAYLRSTGTTRDATVGRLLFDVPPYAGDEKSTALREALARMLSAARPDGASQQDRSERVGHSISSPVFGDDGRVAYVVHQLDGDAAARSDDRYSQLLDTAPDAIVVAGTDGRIDLVNLQAERLFGYTREEMVGQPLTLLIPERYRDGHAAHEARFFAAPSARSMGSGLELFGRRKDGTELPIEVSLSPLRTETGSTVSAAIRDITDRKRMQAATKLMADRLASAVESIQDAFALFDGDDRLVLCNSVYRRLLADSMKGPLVGKQYEELLEAWSTEIAFADDDARSAFRDERRARRWRDQTTTFDVRTCDGRSLRVIDRRTPEGGIVKTIWDLTDDVKQAEELRQARSAAEAASAAKSEFLSSMSHELRTPLNAILGFAQLLQRDKKEPLSDRHKERVAQILKGGEHLLRLIDDILDLSRIEAGGVTISIEPVAVADVLGEVQRTLEPIAAGVGVRLEIGALPAGAWMVSADRTRLAQILINFGSNAIKYNRRDGQVLFTVSTPREDRVRIAVRDTGIGIPEEKQSKLFQPFQRAGQETGPIEGTGIGLVISKRLAELMGGRVGFRSAAGEGSEFWVDMISHASEVHDVAVVDATSAAAQFSGGARQIVLYVEDNPANVTFMRDLMSTFETIDLLVATTAEMGIELARDRRPHLIVMDINLPGMSGLDALGALRAVHETKEIPVIALTAAASDRDRQRGVQAGFYRYLTKPVKVDEFIATLEALLRPEA